MILPSEHGGVPSPCRKKEKKTSSSTTSVLRRSGRRNCLCVASLFFLCLLCGFVSGLIATDHGLDYLSPSCDSTLSNNQCLLEGWNITKQICNLSDGNLRRDRMQKTRLKFCSLYTLDSVISDRAKNKCIVQGSYEECVTYLRRIQNLDESVCKKNSLFLNIVNRFDCKEKYSIVWSCTNCLVSIVSLHLPHLFFMCIFVFIFFSPFPASLSNKSRDPFIFLPPTTTIYLCKSDFYTYG